MTPHFPAWHEVAEEFEFNGSWRDIYVRDAGPAGWQVVLDAIRARNPPPRFLVDGEPADMPARIEDVFALAQTASALLSVQVGAALANCHFFWNDDIEFDIDPREITGKGDFEALARFMLWLGELTGRPVVLTPENSREDVILICPPGSRRVAHSPRADP
ncbi:hypothetical protein [Ancylobacter terrae]|uniref:hypothetical protein n=1 Tax=Ancylobacter sp. sgz301288 TaxID=3342077 RepID=UPI00385B4C14